MNEENQKETTVQKEPKKKSGKAKKIIIAIIAVVIIAAIVIGILLLTGVIDINLSKSSKMQAGVDQLIESYTKPIEDMSNAEEENGTAKKILDNMNADSSIGVSTEISANIEELEIEGMSTSEQVAIDNVTELLNTTTLGIDAGYDGNNQGYLNLKGNVDGVEISGEAVYDGTQLGVRSPELNTKWLTISNEDIEAMAEESGTDLTTMKEQLAVIMEQYGKVAESLNIDEKTQEEIQERYTNVIEEFIKEKSKDAESEKEEIEVDGKDKNSTKLTLELNDDDLKELLKQLLETFKDDQQVQEIIQKYFDAVAEMYQQTDSDLGSDMSDIFDLDAMLSEIDTAIEEIDSLEFDETVTLTVYGTATKTYRIDIEFEIEGQPITIETTFNKDATVTEIKIAKQEIATITIKSDKNTMNIKLELSETAQQLLGTEFSAEINIKNENSKSEMSININAGNYGTASITATTNVNKNEDKEYDASTELKLDINLPDYIVAKMTLNMKNNIKVDNVSIPSIDEAEAVDATDEAAVQTYVTEMESNVTALQEKLMNIESLAPILESTLEDNF